MQENKATHASNTNKKHTQTETLHFQKTNKPLFCKRTIFTYIYITHNKHTQIKGTQHIKRNNPL